MTTPDTNSAGHRLTPAGGPRIRSDVIDVYIFQRSVHPPRKVGRPESAERRRSSMDSDTVERAGDGGAGAGGGVEVYFLQVLRQGPPLADTWHPVMGHVESGETAVACARREMREELGIGPPASPLLSLHALEQVHPFFIAELDAIILSPRFAAEVSPGWSPTLNDEHTDFRWVAARDLGAMFMWPGQIASCGEILEHLLRPGSLMRAQSELAT